MDGWCVVLTVSGGISYAVGDGGLWLEVSDVRRVDNS